MTTAPTESAESATGTGTPTARTARAPRPRARQGEGPWALGYREPLTKNEQTKKDEDDPQVAIAKQFLHSCEGSASRQ